MSSSSTASFSPDQHLVSSSDQLCYVQCSFCDTVLAVHICIYAHTLFFFFTGIWPNFIALHSQVSVPCTSLFKTVTVRCGHCTNLLSVTVNMSGLLLPSPNQLHLGHSFFTPQNLLVYIIEASLILFSILVLL